MFVLHEVNAADGTRLLMSEAVAVDVAASLWYAIIKRESLQAPHAALHVAPAAPTVHSQRATTTSARKHPSNSVIRPRRNADELLR